MIKLKLIRYSILASLLSSTWCLQAEEAAPGAAAPAEAAKQETSAAPEGSAAKATKLAKHIEMHKQMAKAHQEAAACLESGKKLRECRAAFKNAKKGLKE